MQADPFETTNMAADRSHAALLAELNAELDNLLSREPGDFR